VVDGLFREIEGEADFTPGPAGLPCALNLFSFQLFG